MQKQATKFNLDELYPDDPPRAPRPVIVRHEFGTALTKRHGVGSEGSANHTGPSRLQSAWRALQLLLISIGGVVSVAYFASLPRLLQCAAGGFVAVTYTVLYKTIRQWERVRGR